MPTAAAASSSGLEEADISRARQHGQDMRRCFRVQKSSHPNLLPCRRTSSVYSTLEVGASVCLLRCTVVHDQAMNPFNHPYTFTIERDAVLSRIGRVVHVLYNTLYTQQGKSPASESAFRTSPAFQLFPIHKLSSDASPPSTATLKAPA